MEIDLFENPLHCAYTFPNEFRYPETLVTTVTNGLVATTIDRRCRSLPCHRCPKPKPATSVQAKKPSAPPAGVRGRRMGRGWPLLFSMGFCGFQTPGCFLGR